MSVEKIMNKAKDQIEASFNSAIKNETEELGTILELINCYKIRSEDLCLNDQVSEIIYDLFSALYLSMSGLYRQSYISMRCVLEMGVSLMMFNDNEYSYELWLNNIEDIQWSKLNDYETGILSSKYLNLYLPEGNMEILIESIKHYYRECSEYVHGKHEYLLPFKDFKIQYSRENCKKSLKMCKDIIQALITLLVIRFVNKADDFYIIAEESKKKFEV